jgi:hypothetical protein
VQNIVLEIKQYQREWLQHVERMDTDRIPKQALKYRPKWKRSNRTPKEKMEGPASSRGIKNRHCAKHFTAHGDDDDDDQKLLNNTNFFKFGC